MASRITQGDIENLTYRINIATNSPIVHEANHYYLSYAYGGVKLERTCNDGRGCNEVSTDGFSTKRKLYDWMTAFLSGLATTKNYKDN